MSPFPFRLTTPAACEVVGLDYEAFRKARTIGAYPCAPAGRGTHRRHEFHDLVAMCIYRHGMEMGESTRTAAGQACAVRGFVERNPNAKEVTLAVDGFGSYHAVTSMEAEFWPADPHMMAGPEGELTSVKLTAFKFVTIPLERWREHVLERTLEIVRRAQTGEEADADLG